MIDISVLNVAAGKIKPIYDQAVKDKLGQQNIQDIFLVNVDHKFFNITPIPEVENIHLNWFGGESKSYNCVCDIYKFLEMYSYKFDLVTIYRFLEHIPLSRLLYFIYCLSTVVKPGGIVDCIVPDASILARRIINEIVYSLNFQSEDIITTTELVNEPPDSHASIWTKLRAKYYFELEGRFEVITNDAICNYNFDGRDIYLRFFAKRL